MYIRTSCKNILLRLLSSFRFLSIHSCVASASVVGDLHYRTQAKKNTQLFAALIFWQGNLFLRIYFDLFQTYEAKLNPTLHLIHTSMFSVAWESSQHWYCVVAAELLAGQRSEIKAWEWEKTKNPTNQQKNSIQTFFFKQRRLKNHATAAAVSFSSRPTT